MKAAMESIFCTTLSNCDWAATGTMLQGIGTIAGVGAVVWAANKGSNTYDEWRRQKHDGRMFDQAERILTTTYKVKQALKNVRNPLLTVSELNAAEEQMRQQDDWENIRPKRQERLIIAQAYHIRLNNTYKEREELLDCIPVAKALFGVVLERVMLELNQQFRNNQVYVQQSEKDHSTDLAFNEAINRALWDGYSLNGEINEVNQAIETAVATIERICLPSLKLDHKNMDSGSSP